MRYFTDKTRMKVSVRMENLEVLSDSFAQTWPIQLKFSFSAIDIQFGINWSGSNQLEASVYGSSIIKGVTVLS